VTETTPELVRVTPCGNTSFPQVTEWDLHPDHAAGNQHCPINDSQAATLEANTRAQAACPDWFDARKDRITASTFHRVTQRIKSVNDKFLNSLFGSKAFESAATTHGRNTEATAKAEYLKRHPGRHLHDCGLVVNPKFSFLGASPDAKWHHRDLGDQTSLQLKAEEVQSILHPSVIRPAACHRGNFL
jgi:hypothetical protein